MTAHSGTGDQATGNDGTGDHATVNDATGDSATVNDATGDADPRRGPRIAHLPGVEPASEPGLVSTSSGQAEHDSPHEQIRHGAAAGWCRFPGCRNRRQPRLSRRGAPPAYCTEAGHHPEGARRERVRRRRLELATEALLDEHDQPLPAVSSLPPDDEPDDSDDSDDSDGFGEPDSERGVTASGGTGAGPAPQLDAIGPAERPGLAVVPAPRGWSGGSGGSGGSEVEIDPAEHARRLADQLALAATAYEHVAEKTAELQATNAELTRRLAATHRTNDPGAGLEQLPGERDDHRS